MPKFKHIDRRKSQGLDDAYPPDQFVPWNRWLVVGDLKPGQWTLCPEGKVSRRIAENCIEESAKSVID